MKTTLSCDQVSWMLSAIGRYLPRQDAPRVSRATDLQKYALLYEIMELAGLVFADDAAAHNGTPPDVFMLREKSTTATNMACEGMILAGGQATARMLGELMQEQRRSGLNQAPDRV